MDRRTAERLRKGAIRPEARLDLHRRTVDEARAMVEGFVRSSRGAGRRCVLVVTGKGSPERGTGAIRREFPHWLNAPAVRGHVVSCVQAVPGDGGGGAFYLYLKNPRR